MVEQECGARQRNEEGEGLKMKLYIDADVWLNFWFDEMLGLIPASHYAEELLRKAAREGWTIVMSEKAKKEIEGAGVLLEDLEEKLSEFRSGGLLEEPKFEERDMQYALKISGERRLHLSDAIHAALAIKTKSIIVTRNIKHFKKVSDLVKIRKPEDLL